VKREGLISSRGYPLHRRISALDAHRRVYLLSAIKLGSGQRNALPTPELLDTVNPPRQSKSDKEKHEMKTTTIMTLAAVGLLGLTAPRAKADEWNKKTVFTFSGPVEIPGQVLSAGTYVFKLADSSSDRHIVQIFNQDENHLYATILAIPDYRLKPTGKTILTFEERASGAPEAVKAWFYPGDNWGNDFVYPKAKAVELAKRTNQAVPSMPNELALNTTQPAKTIQEPQIMAIKRAPLKAQQPTGAEVEIAQVFKAPPAAQPKVAQAAPATTSKQLPKTASDLPLIGLIGLVSIASAGTLKLAYRRMR
jgi:hypothetical protein